MTPKLSIIIPCYNIEPHISKCVESILEQTFNDFELLLINDGSKDNTLEVCREYEQKDTRVKVYSHDNKGVSYTRNRGIELAQGECILFIDGDDYVKPDYLEKLLNNYEEGIWPICGMINVKKGLISENENYYKLLKQYSNGLIERNYFLDLLKYDVYSSPCSRLYLKSIIVDNKILFNVNVTYQEDLLFNLQYSKYIDKVKLINYFGYFYIEHVTSSTVRFHKRFDHIDLLLLELKLNIFNAKFDGVVKEFIFQTILRRLSNVFHSNSTKLESEKIEEIKTIFSSESYKYVEGYIFKSKVNFLLRCLLKFKSSFLLSNYYKAFH